MYHARYKGTHYEAGFRWGYLLKKHQKFILDNIPFEITDDRIEYAMSCVPIYEEYYSEILDEIRGLAEGQSCDRKILQTVLFGMYAMPPTKHCSCFAVKTRDGVLLGRNSDFLTDLEKLNMNVLYSLNDGAYAFTGNTTAFVEIEDGINEHGLAIGLTSVYPTNVRPGFNAGMLLRYLLEKCRTVTEAIYRLKNVPIASAQTLTLSDANEEIAVIECNSESVSVSTGNTEKFVCATNRFHAPEMLRYNQCDVDDWFAEKRYQTMRSALSEPSSRKDLNFAKSLLAGRKGFICQYDRGTGKDTVWSVIYDSKRKRIYRCEKNPMRGRFMEDTRFKF